MTPQLQNYLAYTAAVILDAIDLIDKGRLKEAKLLLIQGHAHTASGDGLDHLAEQVGLPHRRGVPVPDADVRKCILHELEAKT